ncbi:MAG: proprotein convertase P-domain-containing protein [Deltaproteobacteria bacterium]|nr:proprotein convertase P-domain-containing protein [Deltaproteobacteria bacterium]
MRDRIALLGLAYSMALMACGGSGKEGDDESPDGDADSDGDTDSDSDADADTDSDGDGDGDADSDGSEADCDDGQDDDGDGLPDCTDPGCDGLGRCNSPLSCPAGWDSVIYEAGGLPLGIPDGGEEVRATIDVLQDSRVARAAVRIDVTHPSVADLEVVLYSPGGDRALLADSSVLYGQDLDGTTFVDEAEAPIAEGSAPYSGTFRPMEPLATIAGTRTVGAGGEGFAVGLTDLAEAYEGTAESVTLYLCLCDDCEVGFLCTNGGDDDSDGQSDCADPDCAAEPRCLAESHCDDGIDDDLDGLADCADEDCDVEACIPVWTELLRIEGLDSGNGVYTAGAVTGGGERRLYLARGSDPTWFKSIDVDELTVRDEVAMPDDEQDLDDAGYTAGIVGSGGTIYVFGDHANSYDTDEQSWTSYEMPYERQRGEPGIAYLGRMVFLVGGRNEADDQSSVERYSLQTSSWRDVAPFPVPIEWPATAAVGGVLYAVGGDMPDPDFGPDIPSATAARYLTASDEWQLLDDAPVEGLTKGLEVDGRLWAYGMGQIWIFDPATDTWLADPIDGPDATWRFSIFVLGDDIFGLDPGYGDVAVYQFTGTRP